MAMDSHNIGHDKTKTFMRLMFANDRRIYAYIFVLIPSHTEAEDLFQDTLTVMWDKFDRFREGEDFGAWGIGIAYNMVRNYRRKRAKSHLHLDEDIEILLEQEARQSIGNLECHVEAMRTCINHLSPQDRSVLQLRYENNYPAKTIAEKIGSSVKAIYSRLARVNDLLMRCILKTLTEQGIS
jgi:RNA polymerase sigma-70 factor, ECF subfamily